VRACAGQVNKAQVARVVLRESGAVRAVVRSVRCGVWCASPVKLSLRDISEQPRLTCPALPACPPARQWRVVWGVVWCGVW